MNKYNLLMEHVNPSPTSSSACMMRWINRRCANRPHGEDTERLQLVWY